MIMGVSLDKVDKTIQFVRASLELRIQYWSTNHLCVNIYFQNIHASPTGSVMSEVKHRSW